MTVYGGCKKNNIYFFLFFLKLGVFHKLGPHPPKMVKFNPGLGEILSKVFLSNNATQAYKIMLSLYSEIQ